MADIAMFKKFFYLYTIFIAATKPMADAVLEATSSTILPTIVVSVFMIITILPELLLLFPGYRREIIAGIQDGDGVTNSNDLKFFISWYGPFTALRGIIFIVLYSMVAEYDPPNQIIWALVAVGTGTALPHLKGLFK